MSEPEAGSDVGSLTCRAERSNGSYVINGQKTWITGVHVSTHTLLVCRTNRSDDKHHGLSMISVPAGTDGMEVRPIETMGGPRSTTSTSPIVRCPPSVWSDARTTRGRS